MFDVLNYGFVQRAIISGALLAVFSGIISVFVVLRRISFLGSGIAHAAFGGVAIGFILGINPLLSAILYSLLVSYGIEFVSSEGRLAEDTSIGIFFTASMALGIVLIGISGKYNVDLFGYLFGSILAITESEALTGSIIILILLGLTALILKELYLITFNEELAFVSGIKVRAIKALFLLSMAVAIVLGIKLVGIILISALLVIPGATAHLLTKRFLRMITLSCIVSLISVIGGIFLSFYFNIPTGGTISLLLALFFFGAFIFSRRI
ncbi:MAG: metal ABC transporter permease [Thermodesulfovibrionales bacterium]|nr:metal ABC transporter permease [Thermodesulfovibrionales bacterium]